MINRKNKVFVAMSGGVDSSLAAFLLKKEGYEVIGVFMRCYNIDGCAERDAEDARRVAEHLKIPFYVFDFEEDYKRSVVEYMVKGYKEGQTPNPDVMCNKEIKFGLFLKKAISLGADRIATGHYVRKINSSLYEAKDKNKDQSYFLWTLTEEQLKYCLFPIGDYLKSEVREIARVAGLPTAEKKDSQGICFLGKVTLDEFLKNYIPQKKGLVLDEFGNKVGEHEGAHFYTIGQRRGIGNIKHEKGNTIHEPVYVADKDMKTNTIIIARGENNPALYCKEVELTKMNFINPGLISKIQGSKILVRVRYRQPLVKAKLYILDSKHYILKFNKDVKFVAPGQSAVFYSDKERNSSVGRQMLGGGIILVEKPITL